VLELNAPLIDRRRAAGILCVLAVLGAACAAEHRDPADAAAVAGGSGASSETARPDDYPCGDSASCDARYQTCEHESGGPPPGLDMFSCIPIPPPCSDDQTCACLSAARHATRCEGEAPHVTLSVDWD
jgi:hypothetical protein